MDYCKQVEAMLYNYKPIQAQIRNINLEIEELKNEYNDVEAMRYEEKSTSTNKFNSSVENEVINKEHKQEILERKRRKLEIQIEKIDNAIETLTEDEIKLIKLRYFDRLQFKAIGERLMMNDVYCIQLKSRIIDKIKSLLFISNDL